MKSNVTLTNPDGSLFFAGQMEVATPAADVPAAGPATGTVTLGISGGAPTAYPTVVTLPAELSTIPVPDVPQAREIVISITGMGMYYLTVKDPAGNVCQQTPVPVPGGFAPRGPAEKIEVANVGQVEAAITIPGIYTAEITAQTYRGNETVEAHVNA